jgi:orotidine-5'-phosphate decarboxylase
MTPGDEATAAVVETFLTSVLDRIAGRVAVIKPQIAFFEQLGWRGLRVLDTICRLARERDLLVLLDAKRGDIGSTAQGYASAYLTSDAVMPVDAGRGIFVLVKTSNPGSGDLQDRDIEGEPLFGRVADGLSRFETALAGSQTPWSSLGVVCGATWPDQARRVRDALPKALFLVPGYGAQGGSAESAVQGFVPGPKGLEGGIVNSSRGILFPEAAKGTSGPKAWERAFDSALDQAIHELGNAIQR